ncbi:hypothetical protein N7457_000396 [Penicillium paradoxum]|uniref:uncharacterized protein n=1 Tax=Penicillium paradoxum TaxID=176176 RepID=UPI00254844FA|nr:uncharacterized protein N7457_000396 [Penicillium paradoxum]KAJ5793797.1 hypothetical protein N7457_000396 [Penicillium paradoxum]
MAKSRLQKLFVQNTFHLEAKGLDLDQYGHYRYNTGGSATVALSSTLRLSSFLNFDFLLLLFIPTPLICASALSLSVAPICDEIPRISSKRPTGH